MGVDGKYIQWNEILRDVLNGKLKIVQNQRTESDSESEEGEIEDEGSDFENHDRALLVELILKSCSPLTSFWLERVFH